MASKKKAAKKKRAKNPPAKRERKDEASLKVTVTKDGDLRGERLQVYEAKVHGCAGRNGEIVLGRFLASSPEQARQKGLRLARRIC